MSNSLGEYLLLLFYVCTKFLSVCVKSDGFDFPFSVGLPSGGILSLPKMFLDPRRPEIISEHTRYILYSHLVSNRSSQF